VSTFDAIGDGSLGEGIGRRLLTPGGAVAPGLAPEIFPCVVLENDRPEMIALEGGGLFARAVTVGAGGAGNRSRALLFNPHGDTLCVVEHYHIEVNSGLAVAAVIDFAPGSIPPGGTTNTGNSRDSRQRLPNGTDPRRSTAFVNTDNSIAALTSFGIQFQTLRIDSPIPIVLGPGGGLLLQPASDNVAITAAWFAWRERRINPTER